MLSWQDGQFLDEAAAVSEFDAEGAFETMRVDGGVLPLWTRHMRRLARTCAVFELPWPAPFDLAMVAADLLRRNGEADCVLRLQVSARGAAGPRYSLRTRPRVAEPEPLPVVLAPSARVPAIEHRFKRTPRTDLNALRDLALEQGAHDALLWAADGRLLEATVYSLIVQGTDGVLRTPPLTDGGVLDSVARAVLLADSALGLRQEAIRREGLAGARLWLANAVFGPRPAVLLGTAVRVADDDPVVAAWRRAMDPLTKDGPSFR